MSMTREQTPIDEELLDLEAAADQLCVSKTTLYRLLDRGEVKGIKVGRQWRFRPADLQAYLTRGPVATALSALPVATLDREVAAFAAKLAEIDAAVPPVAAESPDPWEERVLQLLLCIVKLARLQRASDIHFEVMRGARDNEGVLRFRIDGVLHEIHRLPLRVHEALLLRVRLLTTGDTSQSYLDASLHLTIDDVLEDMRISIMPTFLGEALTIRLMTISAIREYHLDQLGFYPEELARVRAWIQSEYGLILVAGPAGSGKTTLLYKLLQEVAGPQRKVVTVEDPVEYPLPWITQVELNSKSRSHASAMRAFMRHDVDVVMAGELRDLETLELALHSAEVGHLALAPVHVVSAVDPPRRVVEVFPQVQQASIRVMLAKNLLGIIGLRLVRVLCPACAQPEEAPAEMLTIVQRAAMQGGYLPSEWHFRRAVGCPQCGGTGYCGRTGIYEVLEVDSAFRQAILSEAPREECLRIAIANGMHTFAAEALRKAAEGITSLNEALPFIQE